ncbi:hypothetical protein BH24DEI2_BH24DEI2_05630 [soil metagenome]
MKKLITVVALLISLSACQKARETNVQPEDDVASRIQDAACVPDDSTCNDLAEDFLGVPGLENVIQALPGPDLSNAPQDSEVTVLYRYPITTPVDELENVITLKNMSGEVVPGSLTLVTGGQLLRFCADEALPPGNYQAFYRPVTLEGSRKVKAFKLNFQVDSDAAVSSNDLPPCSFLETTTNDTPIASR